MVGLGGLGHMAVKIANAMGARVVLFTTSPAKKDDALRLGARKWWCRRTRTRWPHTSTASISFSTPSPRHHNLDAFVNLLKRDATMTLVGAPASPHPSPSVFGLIFKRRRIAGSLIGGIAETQAMLDFCAEHGIVADIEICMQDINQAYERMLKSDVKYRFVIDMSTLTAA
ncbi:NAD(P)-dependent alcohol dehydrogenase OS=Stutzerimonas stutzeri OX=316 GN=CXK95_00185 PE=3 SV=1 [Stutzerimonas stutzeri]